MLAVPYSQVVRGASPIRAWWATTVPFLWRPLIVGGVLAASISLGEFGATSFLSRSGGETMPIAIEQLLGPISSSQRIGEGL